MNPAVRIESDIPYLGPDREEKLDIYFPPDSFTGPRPAVLVIHGGGWRGGDKAGARERNFGTTLASAGYVVFSINYLLNQGEKDPATGKLRLSHLAWPQNFYDCKSALRFIRARADVYGVDPHRIATMGGSAGAHLSLLLAATSRDEEINRHGLYTEQSNAVSCVLYFYGEYDVRGQEVSPFAGATREQTRENESAASPATYFSPHLPPLFITHGTDDRTISVERSRLFVREVEKLATPYWYVEIGGAPHTYHLQPEQMDLRPVVLAFLQKFLLEPRTDT
jgi:acetyl esterase/lipase